MTCEFGDSPTATSRITVLVTSKPAAAEEANESMTFAPRSERNRVLRSERRKFNVRKIWPLETRVYFA